MNKERKIIINEIKEEAPQLAKWKTYLDGQVPDRYFDDLKLKLNVQRDATRDKSTRLPVGFALRIAASIAILFVSTIAVFNHFDTPEESFVVIEAEEEIFEYLINDPSLIDVDFLVELAYEDIYDSNISVIRDEDISDYLDDHIDDIDAYLIIDYE